MKFEYLKGRRPQLLIFILTANSFAQSLLSTASFLVSFLDFIGPFSQSLSLRVFESSTSSHPLFTSTSAIMHYTLPSILALASLAAAAPTPEQKNDPWEGVIDPWGQYGRKPEDVKRAVIEQFEDSTTNSTNFRIAGTEYSTDEIFDLAKRASIDSFAGKIPGCDDDPSKVGTPKPQWAVNEGVRIPKNGNDDACTTGHNADHCWTTYFLVEAAVEYYSWLPTGSAINCPPKGEGDCSIAVTSMAQSCSITGTTSTDGYDHKIIDASAKLGIGFGTGAKNSVDLAGGMGISHNWATTDHKLTNICRADSSTATCHWGGRRSGTVPPGLVR